MLAVSVYVPSRDAKGQRLATQDVRTAVDDTIRLLSSKFGGCTVTAGYGAWQGAQGIVRERVRIVTSFANDDRVDESVIVDHAQTLRQRLQQEAVMYTIQPAGQVGFVGM